MHMFNAYFSAAEKSLWLVGIMVKIEDNSKKFLLAPLFSNNFNVNLTVLKSSFWKYCLYGGGDGQGTDAIIFGY